MHNEKLLRRGWWQFFWKTLALATLAPLIVAQSTAAGEPFDVAVIGGTPAGITAAIAAARQGHSAVLTEYHAHLGGMTSSGLGKSDVETRAAIGGTGSWLIAA